MQYDHPMADSMVCASEAARMAGLPQTTFRRHIKKGWIPVNADAKGRKCIHLDDLSRYIRKDLPDRKKKQRKRTVWAETKAADPTAHSWLYEIIDPKDGQAIYVGFSTDVKRRKGSHFSALRRGRHDNRQLQSLYNKRGRLKFKIIREGMAALMLEAEKRAIKELRKKIGNRLCNVAAGGQGNPEMPKEVRDKIAAKSRANWKDPEYRKRWAKATGRKITGKQTKEAIAKRKALWSVFQFNKTHKTPKEKYSKDDIVWPTMGGTALFPAKRAGRLYWCSLEASRVAEIIGLNWNITNHNGRGHARLKAATKGKGSKVLAKPWAILGGRCSPTGVALLP